MWWESACGRFARQQERAGASRPFSLMGVGGSCRSGFSRELLEPGCLGDWLETHPHPTLPLKGRALHRRACLSVRRSEEHTSELQSLMRISYAVFCLKKKKRFEYKHLHTHTH